MLGGIQQILPNPQKRFSMYYVYVLRSKKDKLQYIGSSANPEESLRRHNFGDYRSTNGHRPFVIYHQESFATKPEAVTREWFFKSEPGLIFLKTVKKNNELDLD